jgi:hypothetical protein
MRSSSHALAFALLLGCGPSDATTPTGADQSGSPDGGSDPGGPDAMREVCDKMDVLFVIDNSLSMDAEQANLGANFPGFVQAIEAFRNDEGMPIDYHLGVTTTGVSKHYRATPLPWETIDGEDGHLQTGDEVDCGMPRGWLERGDPDVAGKFACVANVGVDGSADEMPIEAARLALSARVSDGSNGAFMRDDALLAIVMLTDEDDCSRTDDDFTFPASDELGMCRAASPIVPYTNAFDTLKRGSSRWATAIISGGSTNCDSDWGGAVAAPRLELFADEVGANAVTSSICDADLAGSLAAALNTFQLACNSIGPVE